MHWVLQITSSNPSHVKDTRVEYQRKKYFGWQKCDELNVSVIVMQCLITVLSRWSKLRLNKFQ